MITPTDTQIGVTGEVLRQAREGVGLTLTDLAARVQISKSTLSRFETGQRTLSADLLTRIAATIAAEAIARRGAA